LKIGDDQYVHLSSQSTHENALFLTTLATVKEETPASTASVK